MIYGFILIAIGLLAVPSLVLAKKPNAKEIFDKVGPYMGWIGIISILLGIWDLIHAVQSLGLLKSGVLAILIWVLIVVMGLVELGLGFIMGYSLLSKHALKGEAAAAKGKELLNKLLPLQGKMGISAIIIGIIYVVLCILL